MNKVADSNTAKLIAHEVRNKALGKFESAYEGAMRMATHKNTKIKPLLLDFFDYLNRRGFLKDDLQCDNEHQIETYMVLRKL